MVGNGTNKGKLGFKNLFFKQNPASPMEVSDRVSLLRHQLKVLQRHPRVVYSTCFLSLDGALAALTLWPFLKRFFGLSPGTRLRSALYTKIRSAMCFSQQPSFSIPLPFLVHHSPPLPPSTLRPVLRTHHHRIRWSSYPTRDTSRTYESRSFKHALALQFHLVFLVKRIRFLKQALNALYLLIIIIMCKHDCETSFVLYYRQCNVFLVIHMPYWIKKALLFQQVHKLFQK